MATPVLKDVLASFSPRGDQFVITTGDGRVKTWTISDGRLAHEFTEMSAGGASGLTNGHLSLDYATLAWGAAAKQGSKKEGSRLVLGSRSGDVIAWDPVFGELKWKISNCNPGGVNALCFVRDESTLYSSGADGMVCEIDATSGKVLQKFRGSKSPVTAITVSPDGAKLVVASSEMKVFNLSSKKRMRKFTGHASTVRALCFTRDGRYVLSAASGDRQVAVWDCEGSERGAVLSLSMEHPAFALDSRGFGKEGESLRILAVSEWGETYVWSGKTLKEVGKSSPIRISVASGSKKVSRQCTIFARFLNADSLSLVRGTTAKPTFETLSFEGQTGNVVLEARAAGHLSSQAKNVNTTPTTGNGTVDVLGPDNAADASVVKYVESESSTRKRRATQEPDAEVAQSTDEDIDEVEAAHRFNDRMMQDNEVSLEERLIELGIIKQDPQPAQEIVPPKADSLDALLTQALQAGDNVLLDQCLQTADEKVIANTIKQLKPWDAASLLKAAISRLESRSRRASQLLPWIRNVLLVHATSIVADVSLQPVLMMLYQMIEARLHIFAPLLSLSGRLDLITAQVRTNEESRRSIGGAEPAVVYEEEDSDEEVEDAMEEDDDEEEDEEEENAEDDAMQEDREQLSD